MKSTQEAAAQFDAVLDHLLRVARLLKLTAEAMLKARFGKYAPKSVHNMLNVLSKLLNVAVEWGVIERRPCTIKMLRSVVPIMIFYEEEQYARLVEAAAKIDARVHLAVRGLRRSEMVALRQSDVDGRRQLLHVQRAAWRASKTRPRAGAVGSCR